MGVIPEPAVKADAGPVCPPRFAGVFDIYKQIKFLRRDVGGKVSLFARGALSYCDLKDFCNITGHYVSWLDAEIIMGLDAIFEGR